MKAHDISGQKFGLLEARHITGKTPGGRTAWFCRCDCGGYTIVSGKSLRNGNTRSCGCLFMNGITKHGLHLSPENLIWRGMKYRCNNPNFRLYKNYGGRGIKVCEKWAASFEAFYADMGPRPSELHSIERIDNDGNYEPDNCRWATRKEQQRNRRACRPVIRGDGESYKTLVEAAEVVGTCAENIRSVCSGKTKTAGGYTWAYLP